jgi:cytochrome c oxidase assembly factor CtaG
VAGFDVVRLVTDWQVRPGVAAALVLAAAGYLAAAGRVRRAGGSWQWWRTAAFLAGLAVVAVAMLGGVGRYARVLAWVHMVEHLLLIMVAPPLLAAGSAVLLTDRVLPARWTRLRRVAASRPVTSLTSPLIAVTGYTAVVVGVHLTGLMDTAMRNGPAHLVEELTYLGSGLLLAQLVFGQLPGHWQHLSPLARMAILVVAMPVDAFTGVVMLQTPAADQPAGHGPSMTMPGPAPALSGAQDAHAAGAVMWIGGSGIMMVLLVLVAVAWARHRDTAPGSGGWLERARRTAFDAHTGATPANTGTDSRAAGVGDLDTDEAALEAYNRWLAGLADAEHGRRPAGGSPQ